MKYEPSMILAFLDDKDLQKEENSWMLSQYKQPDPKRKDIVRELMTQLEVITEEFPTFNAPLWNLLFPDMDKIIDRITIVPLVGCENAGNRMERRDDMIYFFIDLINIADMTRIVSQMVYVLQNYLTFEIAKLCIHEDYPLTSRKYVDLLNHLTFTNGLANFLSWNENCSSYKFTSEKYEPRKEAAFGMLASAMEIENKALQHKILMAAVSNDFWNQFPCVAGMFYFYDIYQDLGKDGIALLYRHGPKNFIHTIFHTNL